MGEKQIRYSRSEKGKATQRRWELSPEGKATRAKYRRSPEVKAAQAKYRRSPEVKAAQAIYNRSPQGKAAQAKYERSEKGRAKYARRDKAAISARMKIYNASRREQESARAKEVRVFFRRAALESYGAACACCGETEPMFLAFDHINGGGRSDRKRNGMGYYRYLIREHPDHIQILCHNCNMAKGLYGACPHRSGREE